MMSRRDSRLEWLFGDGAPAFCAAFDLVPDPLGVLWAIRGPGGTVADFETGAWSASSAAPRTETASTWMLPTVSSSSSRTAR